MAQRKNFSPEFKSKVALEAIKESKSIKELSLDYEVYASQISAWKIELLKGMKDFFSDKRKKVTDSNEELLNELYQQIGKLKYELEWLKKKSGMSN